ncbi:MAG: hypothetical protein ACFB2Y_20220 [Fulvivirga sp.]
MLVTSSGGVDKIKRCILKKSIKVSGIIVHRGKDKAYTLTPVSEDDLYFNAERVERIKESVTVHDKS